MFDIWRAGYVRRSVSSFLERDPQAGEIVWLPSQGEFASLADPFGIERDGVLTLFAEAFDYQVRRGEIRYFQYDLSDQLVGEGVALSEPWHLSYPTLIEDGGELFLLPEAYRSGATILYRCVRFPDRWEPVARLETAAAIDATVARHKGLWWMF